jgi:hypothetical protein
MAYSTQGCVARGACTCHRSNVSRGRGVSREGDKGRVSQLEEEGGGGGGGGETCEAVTTRVWFTAKEIREVWLLLTVETEVNGEPKITNESGPWLVRWACCAGTREFCSVLAALEGPEQNIFFPHHTQFPFICPHIALQAGRAPGSRADSRSRLWRGKGEQ